MGTSEIYPAVEKVDEVNESLVVDVQTPEKAFMPLFVVLKEGTELDEDLKKRINTRIRQECSPRHVPDDIFAVEEIPKTLNGKKLEVPVKKILSGTPPDEAASRDSLANPEALDSFAALARRM
ncbi:MAG: acetoacetate--CoA ligase, partial [Rubrobacteraceae bacterium]